MFTGFIGSYTPTAGAGQGIYAFTLDPHSGEVRDIRLGIAAIHPSYLVLSPSRRCLFAVQESPHGSVAAFAIRNEGLQPLNHQSSVGDDPCHLALSPDERFLMVSNYGSASIAVLPITNTGALGEAVQVIQLHGSSLNKTRQESAHAHSCTFSPDGTRVFVCDLGSDRIIVYRYDPFSGRLTELSHYAAIPGSGPRHLGCSPDGKYLYAVNELDSSVAVLSLTEQDGQLRFSLDQCIPTLPDDVSTDNTAAAIIQSNDARYIYVSNRGHDSIAVYAVQGDASLRMITTVPSGGKTPRALSLDPGGAFLFACNQGSDSMSVFSREPGGALIWRADYPLPSAPTCCVCIAAPA
ncbi:MAG: lactonase family protein [Spirochaetaceae bacterium]|jgi:6-phosphogluconolactonase|nr:lactonase family protein [Spirochaetaceae bacterium]